jgi:hypothetical protein
MIRIGYIPSDQRFPHFARRAADRRVSMAKFVSSRVAI